MSTPAGSIPQCSADERGPAGGRGRADGVGWGGFSDNDSVEPCEDRAVLRMGVSGAVISRSTFFLTVLRR